jgi:hypothetical protein
LVSYCSEKEKKVYGLPGPTGRMAYQMAIRNNVKHAFSETKEKAGRARLPMLFKRHPHLTIRTQNCRVSRS